jgi:hypothetical protein
MSALAIKETRWSNIAALPNLKYLQLKETISFNLDDMNMCKIITHKESKQLPINVDYS